MICPHSVEEELSMPANLPPAYFEAEKRFREAKTPESKVEVLEEMLTIMPKHKGTDKLRADLRKRIAKLKVEAQQKKNASRRDPACSIEREGAAQVAVVGPPNVGKSSLVAALTNANPEVGDFPHTTWKPTPGMAPYENIQFQLVDTPPITRELMEPWMPDLMRRADILTVMVDIQADPFQQLEDTVAILEGLRIFAEGAIIPPTLGRLPFIKKMLIFTNKLDDSLHEEDYATFLELSGIVLRCLGGSVRRGRNLMELLKVFYEMAGIIRVYTRAPGKDADLTAPFVLPRGSSLEDLAGRIHKDFVSRLKFAKVWGKAVYDGQMVQRDHVLEEGDIVEIRI